MLALTAPDPVHRVAALLTGLGGATALTLGSDRVRSFSAAGALVAALVITSMTVAGVLPEPLVGSVTMARERRDPLAVLATRVQARTDPADVILVPPFIPDFKLLSKRAVVVDFKSFPYTDEGIVRWSRRMADVYGVEGHVGPGDAWLGDPAGAWARVPAARLVEVAQRHGARYLLTRGQWHARVPAKRVDGEGGWDLYLIHAAVNEKKEPVK